MVSQVVASEAVASAGLRWRQDGEEPCASARMRCFIVGGSELFQGLAGRACCGTVATVVVAPVLRAGSLRGTSAAAVVVISPRVVHSARKAVTTAVHSLLTVVRAMAPHFRVG